MNRIVSRFVAAVAAVGLLSGPAMAQTITWPTELAPGTLVATVAHESSTYIITFIVAAVVLSAIIGFARMMKRKASGAAR